MSQQRHIFARLFFHVPAPFLLTRSFLKIRLARAAQPENTERTQDPAKARVLRMGREEESEFQNEALCHPESAPMVVAAKVSSLGDLEHSNSRGV